MTTTVFLVRHATYDQLGQVLVGRSPGISLSKEGRREAICLAERFSRVRIFAVYASPLQRAWETAAPIAARQGLQISQCEALSEVDFGRWAGMRFDELASDIRWHSWNCGRTTARAPRGETMAEVQARLVRRIEKVAREFPGETVVLVSHGDVIKSALAFYLGHPLDAIDRMEVNPATVSTLVRDRSRYEVVGLNEGAS